MCAKALTNEEVAKLLISLHYAGGPYAEDKLIKQYANRMKSIYGLLGVYKDSFKDDIERICDIKFCSCKIPLVYSALTTTCLRCDGIIV